MAIPGASTGTCAATAGCGDAVQVRALDGRVGARCGHLVGARAAALDSGMRTDRKV